jgi:hypothetical protein
MHGIQLHASRAPLSLQLHHEFRHNAPKGLREVFGRFTSSWALMTSQHPEGHHRDASIWPVHHPDPNLT